MNLCNNWIHLTWTRGPTNILEDRQLSEYSFQHPQPMMFTCGYLLIGLIALNFEYIDGQENDNGSRTNNSVKKKNLLRADRWWLDQSPVDWSVQCHYPATPQPDSSSSFCVRTLQINCRPSSVRAVYQNVVFRSPAQKIYLSVRASGEQLEAAATTSFMGGYPRLGSSWMSTAFEIFQIVQ